MVVAGLDDERDVARGGHERGDDGVSPRYAERTARQEVVLDVDGDQGGLGRHGGLLSIVGCFGVGRARQARPQGEQAR
ncbi:MAG: hypothetical protein Q8K79_07390 [Solirubrobacteraceae bacterium]|nr:hypothetical protein [Solirubrobacteraceae bacterium]